MCDNNGIENELKVYGYYWVAHYEMLVIKNFDLNELSESYNISNSDNKINIYEDIDYKIDPRSLIDEDLLEKIDEKGFISDLEMNILLELIKIDDINQLQIQLKEEF